MGSGRLGSTGRLGDGEEEDELRVEEVVGSTDRGGVTELANIAARNTGRLATGAGGSSVDKGKGEWKVLPFESTAELKTEAIGWTSDLMIGEIEVEKELGPTESSTERGESMVVIAGGIKAAISNQKCPRVVR